MRLLNLISIVRKISSAFSLFYLTYKVRAAKDNLREAHINFIKLNEKAKALKLELELRLKELDI